MLSKAEKDNLRALLEVLPTADVISLASIVTSKAINPKNKKDAVSAILLYETSLISFFNRKKITKGVLINYLFSEKVPCDVSSDKSSLIEKILEHWSQQSTNQGSNKEDTNIRNNKRSYQEEDPVINSDQNNSSKESAASPEPPQSIETELAKQFTCWYYTKLNEEFLKTGGAVLGPEDFWPDCLTTVHLPETDESPEQECEGSTAREGVELLRGFRSQYDLFFSPNVNMDGVRAKTDPHGLVLVAVCGTLHSRAGQCVGVFEQTFGLIADPMTDNNFKIKKTNLFIRRSSQNRPPAILN